MGLLLTMVAWTFFFSQSGKDVTDEEKYVKGRVTNLRRSEEEMRVALKARETAQQKADELRCLVAHRTDWIRIVNGVRECLVDGMWLTSLEPVDGPNGQVVKVILTGFGFKDEMDKAITAVGGPGSRLTPGELLRDRIQSRRDLFSEAVIRNDRYSAKETYLHEFAVEVTLAAPAR